MKILNIWPYGYAHRDGPKILQIDDDVDPQRAAIAAFGPMATVYSVRQRITAPVEKVSESYARMMSQNDNS
jgi:hypothetical protein